MTDDAAERPAGGDPPGLLDRVRAGLPDRTPANAMRGGVVAGSLAVWTGVAGAAPAVAGLFAAAGVEVFDRFGSDPDGPRRAGVGLRQEVKGLSAVAGGAVGALAGVGPAAGALAGYAVGGGAAEFDYARQKSERRVEAERARDRLGDGGEDARETPDRELLARGDEAARDGDDPAEPAWRRVEADERTERTDEAEGVER